MVSWPPRTLMIGSCCTAARPLSFVSVRWARQARLAEAVAKAPGIAGAGVLLTLADTRVTVRLSRDIWNLEPRHVPLARAPFRQLRGNTVLSPIVRPSRKCRWPSRRNATRSTSVFAHVLGYTPMADDNAVRPPWTRIDGLDAGARPG